MRGRSRLNQSKIQNSYMRLPSITMSSNGCIRMLRWSCHGSSVYCVAESTGSKPLSGAAVGDVDLDGDDAGFLFSVANQRSSELKLELRLFSTVAKPLSWSQVSAASICLALRLRLNKSRMSVRDKPSQEFGNALKILVPSRLSAVSPKIKCADFIANIMSSMPAQRCSYLTMGL